MRMSGRWRLVGAVGTVSALALAACGGAEEAAERGPVKIVVSNWANYMPEDLPQRFTEATGIDVELTFHTTNEDIMGKIAAANGAGFDVVFVTGPFAQALRELGWAAKLDHGKIPNLANLVPEAQNLGYDPGNQYSVPYAWGTTGLCYRSDLVAEQIDSWWDLLTPAPELQGKITMLGTDRWLMLAGLKALGFSANTTDPEEIEQAKDVLIEAKQFLLAYDDTTFYSRLVTGEALLVQAWDGWCNYGIAEDPNIKFVVPEEGSDIWVDTMVILESSQNKDAAHAFINFVLEPENATWVAENILYKVPNSEAMANLDPALFEQFPNMAMTPEELLKLEPLQDLGEALTVWNRAVAEIKAA